MLRLLEQKEDPTPRTNRALTPCTLSLCAEDLCKTNPICPAGPGSTGPEGRGTSAKRAKRTQFLDCGFQIADSTRTHAGTPPAACLGAEGATERRNAQNEANFRRSASGPGEQNVQNEAKLGQDRTSGWRHIRKANCAKRSQFLDCGLRIQDRPAPGHGVRPATPALRGPIVQNEPNLPVGAGGMGPQGRGTRAKCAKRTQFCRSAGPWRQKCAKQTQTWAG
jgi:hypothetical protein